MSDSPRFSHTLSRRSFVQLISALAATPSLARGAMAQDTAANAPSRLWYRRPAERWVEALPIGNGRLGAMVFGGVGTRTPATQRRHACGREARGIGTTRRRRDVLPEIRQAALARRRGRRGSTRQADDGALHAVLSAAWRSHRDLRARRRGPRLSAGAGSGDRHHDRSIHRRRCDLHSRNRFEPSGPDHRDQALRRSSGTSHLRRSPHQPACARQRQPRMQDLRLRGRRRPTSIRATTTGGAGRLQRRWRDALRGSAPRDDRATARCSVDARWPAR